MLNILLLYCCLIFDVLQILTAISTVDDLNYPEKTDTYYIVNAPYIFSACWKVRSLRFHYSSTFVVKTLTCHLILGCEASFAREKKKEGSCFAWLWERRASRGKIAY